MTWHAVHMERTCGSMEHSCDGVTCSLPACNPANKTAAPIRTDRNLNCDCKIQAITKRLLSKYSRPRRAVHTDGLLAGKAKHPLCFPKQLYALSEEPTACSHCMPPTSLTRMPVDAAHHALLRLIIE